jgi:6-phosphogluconolactonase
MKFSQIRRITQATALSLAIGLGMTACSENYTIDFLYVTSSRAISSSSPDGNISAYKVDNQSGALTQIVDSPYDSGGIDPVDVVLSPNNQALYVLNNQTSSVVEFLIGTDGKIYPQNTYNLGSPTTAGTFPTSAVIDSSNSFLIVSFTYQHGFTASSPGPGGITVFPIAGNNPLCPSTGTSGAQPNNSLCAPVANGALPYFPVGLNPVAVGVAPNPNNCPSSGGTVTTLCPINGGNYIPYVYVVEQTPGAGTVLSYSLSLTTGQLTSIDSSPAGTQAGTVPHAIAEDPTGRFVYITDQASNQLIGYQVQTLAQPPNLAGSLVPMVNGPFNTSLFPQGITIDPRGKYLYVTNYNSTTITGYAIDTATGTPSGVFSNGTSSTGTGPTCVTVEPSRGIYLYTSNFVDNTISGLQLDPHTGALVNVQNTPFNTAGNPTCAVTVAAGAHAYQAVQP